MPSDKATLGDYIGPVMGLEDLLDPRPRQCCAVLAVEVVDPFTLDGGAQPDDVDRGRLPLATFGKKDGRLPASAQAGGAG